MIQMEMTTISESNFSCEPCVNTPRPPCTPRTGLASLDIVLGRSMSLQLLYKKTMPFNIYLQTLDPVSKKELESVRMGVDPRPGFLNGRC